jgi:hypothetical protein
MALYPRHLIVYGDLPTDTRGILGLEPGLRGLGWRLLGRILRDAPCPALGSVLCGFHAAPQSELAYSVTSPGPSVFQPTRARPSQLSNSRKSTSLCSFSGSTSVQRTPPSVLRSSRARSE